jgi:hypothetical protein
MATVQSLRKKEQTEQIRAKLISSKSNNEKSKD